MLALPDVNVLIALIDPEHIFHSAARSWWAEKSPERWASCAITENGVVRVMSNPKYSKSIHFFPAEVVGWLRSFAANLDHQFFECDLSLRDEARFNPANIVGPKQITDVYLLALAVRNEATLVTFDGRIPTSAVNNVSRHHLEVIGA